MKPHKRERAAAATLVEPTPERLVKAPMVTEHATDDKGNRKTREVRNRFVDRVEQFWTLGWYPDERGYLALKLYQGAVELLDVRYRCPLDATVYGGGDGPMIATLAHRNDTVQRAHYHVVGQDADMLGKLRVVRALIWPGEGYAHETLTATVLRVLRRRESTARDIAMRCVRDVSSALIAPMGVR